jgi:hypothetical protein
LLTGDAGWTQNLTGFGNAFFATVDEGANGVGPWGLQAGYGSASPQWIWNYYSVNSSDDNTVYFSAVIDAVAPIPEPASIALMGLGLLVLFSLRKRQN